MIILGKDGKEYATVKECVKADAEFDKQILEKEAKIAAEKKAKEDELALKKAEVSKRKKELAAKVESSQLLVEEASKEYDLAYEEAQKILADARKKASDLVAAADAKLKDATQEKVKAIREFNKEFGTYTTVLTGDAAWNEYKRISNSFDDTFDMFRRMFRL